MGDDLVKVLEALRVLDEDDRVVFLQVAAEGVEGGFEILEMAIEFWFLGKIRFFRVWVFFPAKIFLMGFLERIEMETDIIAWVLHVPEAREIFHRGRETCEIPLVRGFPFDIFDVRQFDLEGREILMRDAGIDVVQTPHDLLPAFAQSIRVVIRAVSVRPIIDRKTQIAEQRPFVVAARFREEVMGQGQGVDHRILERRQAFPFQRGIHETDIEGRVVGDEDVVSEEIQDGGESLFHRGLVSKHLVRDVVDAGGSRGHRHLRVDEHVKALLDHPVFDDDAAEFDDAVIAGAKAGRFGVEDAITAFR